MSVARRVFASLCAGALLLGGVVFAFQSQSPSFTAQPQAFTSGGGASASASYSSPQQAIGPLVGVMSSASYSTIVGAVMPVAQPPEPTSVNDWQQLQN